MHFLIILMLFGIVAFLVFILFENYQKSDSRFMKEARKSYIRRKKENERLNEKYNRRPDTKEHNELIERIEKGELVRPPVAELKFILRHFDKLNTMIADDGTIILHNASQLEDLTALFQKERSLAMEKHEKKELSYQQQDIVEQKIGDDDFIGAVKYKDGSVKLLDTLEQVELVKYNDAKKVIVRNASSPLLEDQSQQKNSSNANSTTDDAFYPLPRKMFRDMLGYMIESKKVAVENEKLVRENRAIQDEAYKDALTRVFNRKKFDIDFPEDCNVSELTLAFIDGDKFKSVNDTYGHDCGDAVLKMMADTVFNSIRELDIEFYRYGGEEFIIV